MVTVLNESPTVDELMASLAAQTLGPTEVVVVDGGSRDDTIAKLKSWESRLPLRLLVCPGANISQGRNAAIRAAECELIAVTDAGVRLHPTWLSEIVAPFRGQQSVDVVSGFFEPDTRSIFELAMGATVLPTVAEIRPDRFLPSSRSVAFRKSSWERVGGYPEWLDYCEDLVFDLQLRRAGCAFAWAPEALVAFRPRGSLSSFFRQYFLYARGDGKAGLWPRRHAIRYGAYAMLLACLPRLRHPLVALPLLLAGSGYLYRPYARLLPRLSSRGLAQRMAALALVPIIRAVGDVAKMCGYPVGALWRMRRSLTHPARQT